MNIRYILLVSLLLACQPALAQKSRGDLAYEELKTQLDQGNTEKALAAGMRARQEYLKEGNYYRYFVASQAVYIYYQDTQDGEKAEQLILETLSKIPTTTAENKILHAKLHDNLGYNELYLMDRGEKAIEAYTRSIQLYQEAGQKDAASLGMEYMNRSAAYAGMSRNDKAAEDLERAIPILESDSETTPADLAMQYLALGTNYSEAGVYAKAEGAFTKAAQLCPADQEELWAKIYNDRGILLQRQQLLKEAFAELDKARITHDKLFGHDAEHYAPTIINQANVVRNMGDAGTAMKMYQEVLGIYQKTPPDDITLIDLQINISQTLNQQGLNKESLDAMSRAREMAITKFGDESLVAANVYMSLAAVYFEQGGWDLSITYNFRALKILQDNNYTFAGDYAIIYNNVGQAYDELGDTELAISYKKKALELYRQLNGPTHPSVAMATGNIGLSYEAAGDYDEALKYLNESLAIRLKSKPADHDDVGTTWLNIGLMHLKKLSWKESIAALTKAKSIYDRYSKHVTKAMIYNRLAVAYEMTGDFNASQQALTQAFAANLRNATAAQSIPPNPDYLNYYEYVISCIATADGDRKMKAKTSLLHGLTMLDAADRVLKEKSVRMTTGRDRLDLAQLNAFFTESGIQIADQLHQLTGEPSYLEKAFYFAERSKGNELFADLQTAQALRYSGAPNSLIARRAGFVSQLQALVQQTAAAQSAGNESAVVKLKSEELSLTKQLAEIDKTIGDASPGFGMATRSRVLPPWTEIKSILPQGTVLVEYILTDSSQYVLIGNSARLTMKKLKGATNIDKLVRGYINQIRFQGDLLNELREQLTSVLWSPVEETLREMGTTQHIVIVPEGSLNYLPFESLGKGKYLIEQFTISYQPSAAMLTQTTPARKSGKPSFIAMAPVFADEKTNYVNKSCERFVKESQKADNKTRAFSLNGEYIEPLPATEKEVEAINQLHTDKGIFTRYFTHGDAREELIKSGELANYDYIHFATHGFVNTDYPELSGLLLTQDPKSQEDGILYSGEIIGLSLKADLVTLSACETALGKRFEGEGIRGLTTAFLFAGARSVVSSLWKVADESTAKLMIEFYNQLLNGRSKAEALRLAKLSLIADGKNAHPYYWAPFVLMGQSGAGVK